MTEDQQPDAHRCVCRRRLEAGWYLCTNCSERLSADLLEVADRYHKLSAAPAMQPGRYDRSGSNKPGSKPPLQLNIVAMRDPRSGRSEAKAWKGHDGRVHTENENDTPSVLRELGQWVGALVAHLGYEHLPAPNVDDVVAWLNRQSEQIARWYDAPGLATATKMLRNRLRSATNDANDKPLPLACFDDVETPAGVRPCGKPVFPPNSGTGEPAVCTGRPRHEYDARRLVLLQLELERVEREKREAAEREVETAESERKAC